MVKNDIFIAVDSFLNGELFMHARFYAVTLTIVFAFTLNASTNIDLAKVTANTLDQIYATMETSGDIKTIITLIDAYKKAVNKYLAQDSDINKPINESGQTALMAVAQYQHSGLVKILLNAGADTTIKDTHSNSALTYALITRINMGSYGGLQALIASGYDPNNHIKTVRYLLESMDKNERALIVANIISQLISPKLSALFALSKAQLTAAKQMLLQSLEQAPKNNKNADFSEAQLTHFLKLVKGNTRIDAALNACLNFLKKLKEQGVVDDVTVVKKGLHTTKQFMSDLRATRNNIKKTKSIIIEQFQKGNEYIKDVAQWSFDSFEKILGDQSKQKKLESIIADFAAELLLNYYLER